MDNYVTGMTIRTQREKHGMTQQQLADKLNVSDKTVSKWENGRGLPDVSLLEPISQALHISLIELINGEHIVNSNRSSNMKRSKLYVCPVCGNVIHSTGTAVVSCCGIVLPPLEAEAPDDNHHATVEEMDGEYFVSIAHPMTKEHYISFAAIYNDSMFIMEKLYPEGRAEVRLPRLKCGTLLWFCNRHGLFAQKV